MISIFRELSVLQEGLKGLNTDFVASSDWHPSQSTSLPAAEVSFTCGVSLHSSLFLETVKLLCFASAVLEDK